MVRDVDPEGANLPVKLDSTSNGEFVPIPLAPHNRHANYLAHQAVSAQSRYKGLQRRQFVLSSCGVASTLLAFNEANAAAGKTAGYFAVPAVAALDDAAAQAIVEGNEFIFDIQGHFVNPRGEWLNSVPAGSRPFSGIQKAQCALAEKPGKRSYLQCLSAQEFIKDVFLDSDTDMMVLSFVPSTREAEPITIEEADATRRIVDAMEGTQRLLLHGRVNPNQDGDLQAMDELAERWKISAWKTYTQWGPNGKGFWLSDEDTGIPFIEKAIRLGIKNICIHKGLPLGKASYKHSRCDDIGVVARRYPQVNFIVYHAGLDTQVDERAYDPAVDRYGIDTLVRSVLENAIQPNSNVYAELGSSWRHVMRDPNNAAHALGKLFKYVGENNVLWGTDSIWYGSPQDQIQAFRTFQIAEELQEKYGYPAMNAELRAKVFGLNACKPYKIDPQEVARHAGNDKIQQSRSNYQARKNPHFQTYGPKTRREFLNLQAWMQNSG